MSAKVLFTASTYSHVVHFHLPYLQAFVQAGWEVHVACGGQPTPIPGANRVIHVPFAKQITSPANFSCAYRLGRLMREEGYELVITHTSLAAFFTRLPLLGQRNRPRVINVVHGYLFGAGRLAWKDTLLLTAERLTAPCTDLLLTMNAEDLETASRLHLGREVGFIPGMGVDYSRLDAMTKSETSALRQGLGIARDTFLLVFAAEFSHRKNQAFLIRALKNLPDRTALLLPGDGAELASCRALAADLGLEHRVYFPGYVDRPAACYRAADCAVSSSRSEGLPFNIIECMYLGLPVVASDAKGHRDLLKNGRGLLYPFGDEAAFCSAVQQLMEDKTLENRLRTAAQAAAADFSLGTVYPQVTEAYGLSVAAQPAGSVMSNT